MVDVNLVLNIGLLTRTSTNTPSKIKRVFILKLEGTDIVNYTKV